MKKLVAFDLDNTLAEVGKEILQENVQLLKEIEKKGARIAFCSGKPAFYLCGLLRQVGLEAPVIVGENGMVLQFGVDLPPREYYVLASSEKAKRSIALLKKEIVENVPDMWFQPNEVMLTPFPKRQEEFAVILDCMERLKDQLEDVIVYRHADCFDIVPVGITKKDGLQKLCQILGVSAKDVIAAGDCVNDYPMFEFAGTALGVKVDDISRVDKDFSSTGEMLKFVLDIIS